MLELPDLTGLAQGDILSNLYVFWLVDPDFYVVPLDEDDRPTQPIRLSQGGHQLYDADPHQIACVFSQKTAVMLISQTCDIVQKNKENVLVAPVRSIETLEEQDVGNCRANRIHWAFYLPPDGGFPECFVDLRSISCLHKGMLAGYQKVRSLSPTLANKLSQVLIALLTRPALLDEIVQALHPFVERVRGWGRSTHNKIDSFHLRVEGRQLHLLCVLNEEDQELQERLRQIVANASQRSLEFDIDVQFAHVDSVPLGQVKQYQHLDFGYLSYED